VKPLNGDECAVENRRAILVVGTLILIGAAVVMKFEPWKQPEREPLPSYYPTSGWRIATPDEVGLRADVLANMVSDIRASNTQTRCSLVVRDGYLVVEEYYQGYGRNDQLPIYSCTKSVVSTLIGIAVAEGKIGGVGEKLRDLLPAESMEPGWRGSPSRTSSR
jgi:hypothetical protein